MQDKRPIYGLPFILAMGGIILWLVTFISYFSYDHGTFDRWKFIIISGSMLLLLLGIARGSWSASLPRSQPQHNINIGCFLTGCVVVVSFFLLTHFFFTVCS